MPRATDIDTLESGGVSAFFGAEPDYDDRATSPSLVTSLLNDMTDGLDDGSGTVAPEVVVTRVPDAVVRRRRVVTTVAPTYDVESSEDEQPFFADYTRPRTGNVLSRLNDRYELWKIDTARRCEPACERFFACRRYMARGTCTLLVVGALVVLVVLRYATNPRAYVQEIVRPTYARHGHVGVDLSVPASPLKCSEITSGLVTQEVRPHEETVLARVRDAMDTLIRADALHCMCAPMVRSYRRVLALALDTTTIVHMYNARIDTAWTGELADGTRLEVGEWLSDEEQHHLFPDANGTVSVVRKSAVRLTYMNEECASQALVVQARHVAYCVQACCDLFDGKSVYDMAYTPQ